MKKQLGAAPANATDAATKGYVDSVAGAPGVSAATPSTTMKRDAAGRAQVVDPSASQDIATKFYVDYTAGSLTATADSLVRRDSSGRIYAADPTLIQHVATKNYADTEDATLRASIEGTSWKNSVRACATSNVSTSAPGASIDGVTMNVGDRFLLTAQTTVIQNGIWVWNGAAVAATRAPDNTSSAESWSAMVYVREGATNLNTLWRCNITTSHIWGTDGVYWIEFDTSSVVANSRVKRDSSSRAQFADPSAAQDAATKNYVDTRVPTGSIQMWPTPVTPSGYMPCQGQQVSRTTYSDLFAVLNAPIGTATITIATSLISRTSHGLDTGQKVYFTTTGALPTGMAANVVYWVKVVDAHTFKLAPSLVDADAGLTITLSGTQSGTHTVRVTSGVGDGSTTFNLPNMGGRVPVGVASFDSDFVAPGRDGGSKAHFLTEAEMPVHTHAIDHDHASFTSSLSTVDGGMTITPATSNPASVGSLVRGSGTGTGTNAIYGSGHDHTINPPAYTGTSGSKGGGTSHNNMQPYITVHYIIKT